MFVEAKRTLLEDVDTIESAVAKRLRKDPQLLGVAKGKYVLLQQYELRCFEEKYSSDVQKLSNVELNQLAQNELDAIDDNFGTFDEQLEKIKQKHNGGVSAIAEDINRTYAPFSSVLYYAVEDDPNVKKLKNKRNQKQKLRVKRKCILSVATQHINLENIFQPEESYGKFLNLAPFHLRYVLMGNPGSYVEYLHTFSTFPYKAINEDYKTYLIDLLTYLVDFVKRSQPLFTGLDGVIDVESFEPAKGGEVRETGEIWCDACEKLFTKESVYQGHLTGKKHKKAEASKGTTTADKSAASSSNALTEWKITKLANYLEPTVDATKSNAERKATLTDREKLIERSLAGDEDSDYTTVPENGDSSDSDPDSDYAEENIKDLPLGVDGRPMPFWLYKLQGLHKSYTCEICGNASYKGRLLFSQHFLSNKHQHGLKFLGVDDEAVPLFKDVTDIAEAMDLWKKVKKERRIQEGDEQNTVEVEDNEGNVMLERDYIELKKQGLL